MPPYRFHHDQPPKLAHVETAEDCLEYLRKRRCDLLIIFNPPKDLDVLTLTKAVHTLSETAIMVLGNNVTELSALADRDHDQTIDSYFTWNGDGKIILTMIQYLEDKKNAALLTATHDYDLLLLIEDSIHAYSAYLIDIYDELRRHLDATLPPEASDDEKLEQWRKRPFILHTTTLQEARHIISLHQGHFLGIITDNHLPDTDKACDDGAHLAAQLRTQYPTLPILLQSSEPIKSTLPRNNHLTVISKNDQHLTATLQAFLQDSLGPTTLVCIDDRGKALEPIHTMREFEDALVNLPATTLKATAAKRLFSRWLRARGDRVLADKIEAIEKTELDDELFKQRLVGTIEEHRYTSSQIQVTQFLREAQGPSKQISRIGDGALGGKARGLAFLSKLLSTYLTDEMTPGIHITLPRSIVLSTDVFDTFIAQNHLLDSELFTLPDERITAKFMGASLPPTVLGDLRAFIRNSRKPLIVRSSGMLEDSLMQPFAGIYASILLPNESWETDFRFQDVCNAVKYVFSSTYSQRARTYIRNTPKNIRDEKMAVLIQEVVGERHGDYFYPAISGVAKSYNYYPAGSCTHEDGIVYLAVGLGKAIVDGGSSFCFCPEHPRAPLFGTPKDFIRYSQTRFYALNLHSIYRIVEKNEDTTLKSLDITLARKEGLLNLIASTYLPRDDTLYPGLSDDGVMVLDFGPMLSYDTLPLAKALKLLMRISELALGYPVEIEFAVNLPTDGTSLSRARHPPGPQHAAERKTHRSQPAQLRPSHRPVFLRQRPRQRRHRRPHRHRLHHPGILRPRQLQARRRPAPYHQQHAHGPRTLVHPHRAGPLGLRRPMAGHPGPMERHRWRESHPRDACQSPDHRAIPGLSFLPRHDGRPGRVPHDQGRPKQHTLGLAGIPPRARHKSGRQTRPLPRTTHRPHRRQSREGSNPKTDNA